MATSTAVALPALSAGQESPTLQQYLVQPVAESMLSNPVWNTADLQSGPVVESIICTLLQETLKELQTQSSASQLASEPVPYFENQRPSSPLAPFLQHRQLFEDGSEGRLSELFGLSEPSSVLSSSSLHDESIDQETLSVLCSPAFASLGNFLLESTMQNLVSEALHGDFDPSSPPRQIVSGTSLLVEDVQALAVTAAAKAEQENIAQLRQFEHSEEVGLEAAHWKAQQLNTNDYFVTMHTSLGTAAAKVLESTVAPEANSGQKNAGVAPKRS